MTSLLAPVLLGFISLRLLLHGKTRTFIDDLHLVIFAVNTVSITVLIYPFFTLAYTNLLNPEVISEKFSSGNQPWFFQGDLFSHLCANFFSMWLLTYTFLSMPNVMIMFTRFIFARYAHGLVSAGIELFKKVIIVAVCMFCLHLILIWPVRYEISGSNYDETIVGRICARIPIPEFQKGAFDPEFSVKPKMITSSLVAIFVSFSVYWRFSALKQRKKYAILPVRKNFLNIDEDLAMLANISLHLVIDQWIKIPLEIFYTKLGSENLFWIWWFWHLFMLFNCQVLSPACVIWRAWNKFPEFRGLKARPYPGREKLEKLKILPRSFATRLEEKELQMHPGMFAAASSAIPRKSRFPRKKIRKPTHTIIPMESFQERIFRRQLSTITEVESC